ncbi:uncharacterized protein N7473_000288 [Penicillium subrubescens]|uniref:Uncharacterized protein n=1 Tax=Penicillium subrubescens TaxID=1316194 RepID=A0A1Q5SNY1_9EURO|nr:uncharacterized protein N7473_000288 [Penicillium subrubescens]KAJ5910985.1 hypothetical protein N7473_000288 [Penicillium subrubescens]OKO89682.1 hypothetical protein PENSUB_13748 [Penicillium subrubescens]
MYRYSIIIALLTAVATIQAAPLNLFSHPRDGLLGDENTSDMTSTKRSEESSINGDIGVGLIARDDEGLVGPFDVDGILPVDVGGSIVDI